MTLPSLPTLEQAYTGDNKFVIDNTIFATLHGSHAYGLATESSDIDIKGVALAPKRQYLGFQGTFEQVVANQPYDFVCYELTKFMKLAANCNPNIIEVLFTAPECFIKVTEAGQILLDNKEKFLSLQAKFTFAGYANQQLKRINTHYRWIKNAPTHKPTREEFGLLAYPTLPADQIGVIKSEIEKKMDSFGFDWNELDVAQRIQLRGNIRDFLTEMSITEDDMWIRTGRSLGMDENFLELLKCERKYNSALADWQSYQSWLATRNVKRSALEVKFGYDTKHASHLVRLMKMCREILEQGKVIVKRPDREEILAIKNHGIWTYEQLIEWADNQEKELDVLYKDLLANPRPGMLRKKPDFASINELCVSILETYMK